MIPEFWHSVLPGNHLTVCNSEFPIELPMKSLTSYGPALYWQEQTVPRQRDTDTDTTISSWKLGWWQLRGSKLSRLQKGKTGQLEITLLNGIFSSFRGIQILFESSVPPSLRWKHLHLPPSKGNMSFLLIQIDVYNSANIRVAVGIHFAF